MAHDNDTSSPLAGIIMTAFFGIISLVLGAVTMYQVHSIWVKYHCRRRQENRDAGAFSLSLSLSKSNHCNANLTDLLHSDIEHQNSSTSICLPTPDPSEWQSTPSPSSYLPALNQTYTIPPRRQQELFHPDEGKVSEEQSDEETEEGVTTITTRCLARDDEGTFDLSLGVISRFSTDSSEEGEWGEGEGIWAPPGTPVSERVDKEGVLGV